MTPQKKLKAKSIVRPPIHLEKLSTSLSMTNRMVSNPFWLLNSLYLLFLGFSVGEEARNFLMDLKDTNVGVIAVAGKYRTGKSFLLNRIILE